MINTTYALIGDKRPQRNRGYLTVYEAVRNASKTRRSRLAPASQASILNFI
jgi:hypothetical protein